MAFLVRIFSSLVTNGFDACITASDYAKTTSQPLRTALKSYAAEEQDIKEGGQPGTLTTAPPTEPVPPPPTNTVPPPTNTVPPPPPPPTNTSSGQPTTSTVSQTPTVYVPNSI